MIIKWIIIQATDFQLYLPTGVGLVQRPGGLIRRRLRRGAAFFASPGRRLWVSGHDDAEKRYQVPIDGSEVSCHEEIVSVRAKNKAPARRPANPKMLSR
jgi:hypothetical protein